MNREVNKQELRLLARAATQGAWLPNGDRVNSHGSVVGHYIAHEEGGRIAEAFVNCLVKSDAKCRANAAFIAAANPATVLALLDEADLLERLILDVPVAAQNMALPVELAGVAEVVADGGGFWDSCSGCYETEDGHPVGSYHYSTVMQCMLGGGCHECGGLGAVWDITDYEAIAREEGLLDCVGDPAND